MFNWPCLCNLNNWAPRNKRRCDVNSRILVCDENITKVRVIIVRSGISLCLFIYKGRYTNSWVIFCLLPFLAFVTNLLLFGKLRWNECVTRYYNTLLSSEFATYFKSEGYLESPKIEGNRLHSFDRFLRERERCSLRQRRAMVAAIWALATMAHNRLQDRYRLADESPAVAATREYAWAKTWPRVIRSR